MNSKVLIFDLDDTLYEKFGRVGEQGENLEQARLYSGVRLTLHNSEWKKVLVTKGEPELQNRKIDFLKLRELFDEIMICPDDASKKECFLKVKKKYPSSEYWVIGDRIDSEIRWGNELGMKTVRIARGKYKEREPRERWERPNYTLSSFSELKEVLICRR